jgi:hypothetical protein
MGAPLPFGINEDEYKDFVRLKNQLFKSSLPIDNKLFCYSASGNFINKIIFVSTGEIL